MHQRNVSLLIATLTSLILLPGTAFADQHVDEGELTLEPATVQPGESFTVSGQCPEEAGGQELSVLGTDPGGGQLGTVTLEADGSFSGEADVSENSPIGDLEVSVVCGADSLVLRAMLTITEGDGEAVHDAPADEDVPAGGVETGFGGGATNSTSSGVALAAGFGTLLVLAGGLLFARRRNA